MALRKSCRVPVLFALCASLAAGCGGGKQGVDYGWGEDDVQGEDGFEEVAPDALRLTIVSPTPGVDRIVSGTLEVKVRLDDPLGLPATVTFGYSKGMLVDPLVRTMDGPGDLTVAFDTEATVKDGKTRRLVVTAESDDGRVTTADVSMVVDNAAPTVTALDPTPPTGGNFMGDLVVRFEAADGGTGVTKVVVRVEDFQYLWPTAGATAGQSKVDTGEIVIPTRAWTSGAKQVTVEAFDGLQGHLTTLKIDLGFVRSPQFLGGDIRPLPEEFTGRVVAGVRLGLPTEDAWALVVAGNSGAQIVERNPQSGRLVRRADLLQVGVTGARVRDVNGDNLDDIVLWGAKTGQGQAGAVYVFLQTGDGMFFPPQEISLPFAATDLAIGDISGDGLPDFAMVMDDLAQTLGLIISDDTGAEPTWGAAKTYSGAVRPTRVAIGDFAGVGLPAVVLTRSDSPIVTVFPIEGGGTPSAGRNSTISDGDTPISGITGLLAVRLDGDDVSRPDRLVATDIGNEKVLLIQRVGTGDPARVTLGLTQATGLDPSQVVSADFDGNGTSDVAVLCKGGNLVHVFFAAAGTLIKGPAFAVGNALSMTTADLDGDGARDLVLLDAQGENLTWIRYDDEMDRFEAAPMALLGFAPRSLALGRFTRALAGGSGLLDAAVLGQDAEGQFQVVVKAADGVSGLPLLDTSPAHGLQYVPPVGLIAANVNHTKPSDGSPGGVDGGPDDLVIPTNVAASWVGERLPTAEVLVFGRDLDSHTTIVANSAPLKLGDRPRLIAVADFDRAAPGETSPKPYYSVLDLMVLEEHVDTESKERYQRFQLYIGNGTGGYTSYFKEGPVIDPSRNVQQVVAVPLRRSLFETRAGTAKEYEVLTVNAGTGDVTVYVKEQIGTGYLADRSKNFALGALPKAVAVGFLENTVHAGETPDPDAKEILPDLVTLLGNDVVVSYSIDNASSVSGTGTSWNLLDYEPPISLGHQGRSAVAVALADMNGDDYLDILVLNQGDATLSVYVNLANRQFSAPYDFPVGVGSAEMAVADVNGDGCPDVVTADQGGQTLTILRNNVACTPM